MPTEAEAEQVLNTLSLRTQDLEKIRVELRNQAAATNERQKQVQVAAAPELAKLNKQRDEIVARLKEVDKKIHKAESIKRGRLREIREEANEERAKLFGQFEATANQAKRYRSMLAPIRALPMEVLGNIFQFFTEDGGDPQTVLWICVSWSRAALSNPQIWSRIRISPETLVNPQYLPTALRRAGNSALLDITISVSSLTHATQPTFDSFIPAIFAQGHRWRSLTIGYLPASSTPNLGADKLNTVKNLERLHLGEVLSSAPMLRVLIDHIAIHSRRLHELTVTPVFAPYYIPSWINILARVRKISINAQHEHAFQHLTKSCPSVEEVTLTATNSTLSYYVSQCLAFPAIKRLSLRDIAPLSVMGGQTIAKVTQLQLHNCVRKGANHRSPLLLTEDEKFTIHMPVLKSISIVGTQPELLLMFSAPLVEIEIVAPKLTMENMNIWLGRIWVAEKRLQHFQGNVKVLKVQFPFTAGIFLDALRRMPELEELHVKEVPNEQGAVTGGLGKTMFTMLSKISAVQEQDVAEVNSSNDVPKPKKPRFCAKLRVLSIRSTKERCEDIGAWMKVAANGRQAAGRPFEIADCKLLVGEWDRRKPGDALDFD